VVNNADKPAFVSFISSETYKVLGKVALEHATDGAEQPAWDPVTGKVYLFGALVLGLAFLWFVFRLARTKLPTTSPDSRKFARQLLQASVIYLPLLFALMMLNVVHS